MAGTGLLLSYLPCVVSVCRSPFLDLRDPAVSVTFRLLGKEREKRSQERKARRIATKKNE